jgi:hypothetical protein
MLKRLATFLFGVALIGLGVFIFMAPEQAYLVQLLKKSWPLFLVLAGLVRLAGYLIDRHPQSPVGSLLLTALGGIFLRRHFARHQFAWRNIPNGNDRALLVLVFAGLLAGARFAPIHLN